MDLKMPVRVVYGNSTIDDIPGLIPGERVLLVTGRSFAEKSRLLQRLMDMFGKAGKKLSVFSGASPEPGIEEAEACLEQGRDGRAE